MNQLFTESEKSATTTCLKKELLSSNKSLKCFEDYFLGDNYLGDYYLEFYCFSKNKIFWNTTQHLTNNDKFEFIFCRIIKNNITHLLKLGK